MKTVRAENRDKFIDAALEELTEYGVSGFSARRVSRRLTVSGAALYKHFENREELLRAMIRRIYDRWSEIQRRAVDGCGEGSSPRERIMAVCEAYVRFLCGNPEYQTVILMNDRVFSPELRAEKTKLSGMSKELVDEYCRSVGMPDGVRNRKLLAVRACLYGTAALVNSGEADLDDGAIEMMTVAVGREFDLD